MELDHPDFLQEYPFRNRYFQLNGMRYHYVDEGEGEPVVMIHGNPTWSFYYRNLIKVLSKEYRCIAPDHIGMGLSSKPDPEEYGFRLIDRVDDLGTFLDHLQLDQVTLVVHDWGGMIGLTWARKNLQRIKRLIILNTAGFHLPQTKKLPASIKLCRDSRLGAAMVLGLNGFTRAANHWCTTKKLPKVVKQAYLIPHKSWQDRTAVLKFVQDIPLHSADPSFFIVTETQTNLRRMQQIPTLILWGGKDFVFDDHFYREWQDYLPHAQFHYFANAGHYILEDAKEECAELIQRFMAHKPLLAN